MDPDNIQYEKLPNPHPRMVLAVQRWIEDGTKTGDFLWAVITNDLLEATAHADPANLKLLREWVMWFHWEAPGGCHGSREKAKAWKESGGVNGQKERVSGFGRAGRPSAGS